MADEQLFQIAGRSARSSRWLWLCEAVVGLLLVGCGDKDRPDLIFHGGPILTVNASAPVVEAVAIRDGVITATGKAQEVLALKTARTEIRDLQGHTLMPGFIAAHEHPTLTALFGGVVDVSGFTHQTNEQVWGALRHAVATTTKGEWIYAMGIDPILVPDLEVPSRETLDAVAPDHPLVLISQTMHSFWANSNAFAAAGITDDTPDPGSGSFYERDAQGELTGFVSESAAASPLLQKLKSPWRLLGRYEQVLDDLLAAGFTSVASLGHNVPPLMARYAASRRLHPRIRQFFYLAKDELSYLPATRDASNPYFRIQGIKLWHDGSPYTGSMYLEDPYLDSPLTRAFRIMPHSRGTAMIAKDELPALLNKYAADGWQVAIHSQGDQSSLEVARAFGQVAGKATDAPDRIEHCLLLPTGIMPELARLRISPSFHINHIYYYGDALESSILGVQRAGKLLPIRTAFDLNMRPTLHADSPMFPADAFSLMKTAVLRRTRSGQVLGADQAITIEQAIQAMTINGAHQLGMHERLGSIEVGKWADVQILSENPYRIPAEQFERVKVLEVFVMGRRQFTELQ